MLACGFTPAEYADMTLPDVAGLLRAKQNTEVNAEIAHWRRTRKLATLLYNINVEEKHQKSETEFMPLPGDEPSETSPDSPHFMEAQFRLLAAEMGATIQETEP